MSPAMCALCACVPIGVYRAMVLICDTKSKVRAKSGPVETGLTKLAAMALNFTLEDSAQTCNYVIVMFTAAM